MTERLLQEPAGFTRGTLNKVPMAEHPTHPGAHWGITFNDYWRDYTVDTGYFGASRCGDSRPSAWTTDQDTFAACAIIWWHRDAITAAIADPCREHDLPQVRLGIGVTATELVIAEYDWRRFTGVRVRRADPLAGIAPRPAREPGAYHYRSS